MNEVLGDEVGNALEIAETIAYLKGDRRESRLHEVTLALAAEMLVLGGIAADTADGRRRLQQALDSGAAAEKFAQMVVALGGPADLMERPQAYLPAAPVIQAIAAPRAGVISAMKTRDIGLLIVEMGGGRRVASDAIDFRVGLSAVRHVGDAVAAGEPLALVHAADQAQADRVIAAYQAAVSLADPGTAITAAPIVMDVIG